MTTLAMTYPMLTHMDEMDPTPEAVVQCPICGAQWEKYDGMWEAEGTFTSSRYPVGFGKCRACVWEKRTEAQLLAYLKANDLGAKVLQHCMIRRTGDAINTWMWRELLPAALEAMPDVIAAGMDEYMSDNALTSDFIDYVMEG